MNAAKIWIAVWGVGLCVAVTSEVSSQDPKANPQAGLPAMSPEDAAKMQEYMKLMQPSEPHKQLARTVGVWDTTTKVYMGGPGTPPAESTGSSTFKSVLGGNWVLEEHSGTMMGMPYHGMGMAGYDNYKNLYVATWFSNMSTELLQMSGARHPQSGVVTMYGVMDEPMLGVHSRTVKYVVKPADDDHFTFEIIDLHAGDDYKVIEIHYSRRK